MAISTLLSEEFFGWQPNEIDEIQHQTSIVKNLQQI